MPSPQATRPSKLPPSAPPYYTWDIMSDYTRKTGKYPAVISYIGTIGLWKPGRMGKLPKSAVAKVVVDGPYFDVMSAISVFIVSPRVRDFLASKAGDCFEFLPFTLESRNGVTLPYEYYGVRFLKWLPAKASFKDYDLEQIGASLDPAMIVYCPTNDDCIRTAMVHANLAGEMVAQGFTGLGFENPFGLTPLNAYSCHQGDVASKKVKPSPAEKRLEQLQKIALEAPSIRTGWEQLHAYCSTPKTGATWNLLKDTPVEQDVADAREWLSTLLAEEPPPATVRAFWFGLFEDWENEMDIPKLYVSGSTKYKDETKYDIEWAVNPGWWPEKRYFKSAGLEAIGRFADANWRLRSKAMYTAVLGYGLLLVRFAIEAPNVQPLINPPKKKARAVAVGFDSGDFLILPASEC